MTDEYHRCVEFLQAKAPELQVFEHEPGEVIVNCYVLQDYIIKLLKVREIAKTASRDPHKKRAWVCPDCGYEPVNLYPEPHIYGVDRWHCMKCETAPTLIEKESDR